MRPIPTLLAALSLLTTLASTRAGTIDLIVNAYATYNDTITPIPTKCGDTILTSIEPGSIITYEIAVAVDPAAAHPQGNKGLATIVFDVLDQYATAGSYEMPYITAAESGYQVTAPPPHYHIGPVRDVTDPMYAEYLGSGYPGSYNGGWGFDNSGLPIGGEVTTSPGDLLGAGAMTPLTWYADVNMHFPGVQPHARLGVGIGTYTFPGGYYGDPVCGGLQGGFGQDISNISNPIPGDGHWLMFRSTIDTSGWAAGADYGWNIIPTDGAVYSATFNYNVDIGGGFRIDVDAADMTADSFAFTLIPEPAGASLLLLAVAALVRRRRSPNARVLRTPDEDAFCIGRTLNTEHLIPNIGVRRRRTEIPTYVGTET